MKKQLEMYPYNLTENDESVIFISDKLCEKFNLKKRHLIISIIIFFGNTTLCKPAEARNLVPTFKMSQPTRRKVDEPTVNQRLNKTNLIKANEFGLCVYERQHTSINSSKINKTIFKIKKRSFSLLDNIVFFVCLYEVWLLCGGTHGFVPPHNY